MHTFKNYKIQALYNYLVNDFNENDFFYDQSFVLDNFGLLVNKLNEADWLYFEANINLWDSGILNRLARVIVEYNSIEFNYQVKKKIYCLAFINCWDTESLDLCDNLPAELGLYLGLDEDLLKRIILRLEELLNNYTVVTRFKSEIKIMKTLEFVKEKLKLTALLKQY